MNDILFKKKTKQILEFRRNSLMNIDGGLN